MNTGGFINEFSDCRRPPDRACCVVIRHSFPRFFLPLSNHDTPRGGSSPLPCMTAAWVILVPSLLCERPPPLCKGQTIELGGDLSCGQCQVFPTSPRWTLN